MAKKEYKPGCFFDGSRGKYIGTEVQKLAESNGWDPGYDLITDPDDEDYLEATAEAEDWLNDFVVTEGHYWGYNEYGDFGLWPMVVE
jgi:hypothetical protein